MDNETFVPEPSDFDYDPTPDIPQREDFTSISGFAPGGRFFETREWFRRSQKLAVPKVEWEDVRWVDDFSNNPDYAHLPAVAEGLSFELTADILFQAIDLGFYKPYYTDEGLLIVAIRGAGIEGGANKIINYRSVRLVEMKPDHRDFKCLIGVLNERDLTLSLFQSSTVPNRGGVSGYANKINGNSDSGSPTNLLPTGCYELCVGTHYGSRVVPNVLRLGTSPRTSDALSVTVLRTTNDGVYGTKDRWDYCEPADNIHPSFAASSASFSSLGCLTVPGSFSDAKGHSGPWRQFQQVAGFAGAGDVGKRYNLLLTTGMELAAIWAANDYATYGSMDLRRLSHGSEGPEVEALQVRLGIPTGTFGPQTKEILATAEAKATGAASGIYSHKTESVLGYGIF